MDVSIYEWVKASNQSEILFIQRTEYTYMRQQNRPLCRVHDKFLLKNIAASVPQAISGAGFWCFTIAMCMRNRNLGIPPSDDGLFWNLLIFEYFWVPSLPLPPPHSPLPSLPYPSFLLSLHSSTLPSLLLSPLHTLSSASPLPWVAQEASNQLRSKQQRQPVTALF